MNRPSFSAIHGRGHELSNNSRDLGFWSYVLGLSFALLSFLACSPHFVVNSLTVFCCSLSFGMSMSIESLENVRRTTRQGVLSMVKPRRLNTLVIGYILIGQLVGGSGGKPGPLDEKGKSFSFSAMTLRLFVVIQELYSSLNL